MLMLNDDHYDEQKVFWAQDFEGFKTMSELTDGANAQIPAQKGVYVVFRESDSSPQFPGRGNRKLLQRSPAKKINTNESER